jgi:hypothetical protein
MTATNSTGTGFKHYMHADRSNNGPDLDDPEIDSYYPEYCSFICHHISFNFLHRRKKIGIGFLEVRISWTRPEIGCQLMQGNTDCI